jgi:hypothetical protein
MPWSGLCAIESLVMWYIIYSDIVTTPSVPDTYVDKTDK